MKDILVGKCTRIHEIEEYNAKAADTNYIVKSTVSTLTIDKNNNYNITGSIDVREALKFGDFYRLILDTDTAYNISDLVKEKRNSQVVQIQEVIDRALDDNGTNSI